MSDTTKTPPKGVEFYEVSGSFPAWLWRGIRETERSARDGYIPATVLKDGNASFVLVTADAWNTALDNEWGADR